MIFSGLGVDWGSRQDGQKPVLTFFLLVLNLLYRVGIMVLLQRKLYRGGPTFSSGGGGPAFSRRGRGGPNTIFYKKTYKL